MVEKIEKISPVQPSAATHKDWSTSIESEPDRAWVALRQDQISADIESLNETLREEDAAEEDAAHQDANHERGQRHQPKNAEPVSEETLSGESPCIGTGNLEEDVPFGSHVGFV